MHSAKRTQHSGVRIIMRLAFLWQLVRGGDTSTAISTWACTLVLAHTIRDVFYGNVNLLHIHHQVHRTHQISTVACVLRNIFTILSAYYAAPILIVCGHWSWITEPWKRVALHVAAVLLAQTCAVGYKVCVILYKVWRYRTLTKKGLTGENRKNGLAPRRILIAHASVGSGHKRAAQAIREALEAAYTASSGNAKGRGQNFVKPIIKTLDVVDSMEWFLKAVYKDGFMTLVTKDWGSAFVGLMFDKSNRNAPGLTIGSTGFVQTMLEESFMLSFVETIFNFKPDIIVNTHFLPLKVLSHMRKSIPAFDVPQVTVVTDYDVHAYWAVMPCERFFVARDECQHALTTFGISSDIISVTGMPVVRDFTHGLPTREECLAELGLDGSRPVVLMMAGGSDVFDTYEALLSLRTPIQIALVCGRYADKKARLEKLPVPARHKCKIEGFTRKMHYYLQCADIIITKPGGLTTAESLATGTAIAVYHSLPGQEQRNADMILEAGAGFKIQESRMLAYKLEKVLKDRPLLERMKSNAERLGCISAADRVAEYVLRGRFE